MFNNATECRLYADDIKQYSETVTDADCLLKQHGLDGLVSWSDKWQRTISNSFQNYFACK